MWQPLTTVIRHVPPATSPPIEECSVSAFDAVDWLVLLPMTPKNHLATRAESGVNPAESATARCHHLSTASSLRTVFSIHEQQCYHVPLAGTGELRWRQSKLDEKPTASLFRLC